MAGSNPPEITLELSGGSLTIRTAEAIYRILVTAGPTTASLPAGAPAQGSLPKGEQSQALPSPDQGEDWDQLELDEGFPEEPLSEDEMPVAAVEGDEEYYRELSHDMYREVGRLARRLSMSIRDVQVEKLEDFDLEGAGQQLEHAKDQLEGVVKMTEQATMKIMDMGEKIQEAIDQTRGIMERINTEAAAEGEEGQPAGEDALAALNQALDELAAYLEGLQEDPLAPLADRARSLADKLSAAPQAPAPAEEAEPEAEEPALKWQFPLDLVFQTAYELCTNDTVKKHIKAMWDAAPKAFDQASLEKALNALAPEAPDEDNFLILDLKGVLKAMFNATKNERFRGVIKKMAATSDQIFLEQTLPLEAIPAENKPAPKPKKKKPAPPPAPTPDPEVLAGLAELAQELESRAQALTPPRTAAELKELVERALAAALPAAPTNTLQPELIQELEEQMNTIITSVNTIIEALSFQDLSGQAIYRIVRLLTDFQVQLLAMVVSFGSKLKAKATRKDITIDEGEKLAQEEVDKALERLGLAEEAAEGEPAKLDQDQVNQLLESLGF